MSTPFKPLFLGVFALALAACASTPPPATVADTEAAPVKTASATPDCITSTGTRIVRKENDCTASPGRVFSKDDLDNTGAISVAEALQRLDPRFGR